MAKVTPPQEIPSDLLDGYRSALGEKRPDNGVRKRYPYRVPTMQTLVGHPSTKQKAQRARFITAKNNFINVDWATRQRWYAAAPPWSSLLWYYNYFILSSLTGNANISQGGIGVIKSIQRWTPTIPTTGYATQGLDPEIDITKSIAIYDGASYKLFNGNAAVTIHPYTVNLIHDRVLIAWSLEPDVAAPVSVTVIEYI